MKKISPVIIIGLNRNGTTWLCNELIGRLNISSHGHPLHYGYKESLLHRNQTTWGDLSDPDRLIRFLEAYGNGDLFRLAKGDKAYFYQNPPNCFYEFYFELMDQYCTKEGSNRWLTKVDASLFQDTKEWNYFLKLLHERYAEVSFIGIKRDFKPYINSYANMVGERYGKYDALFRQIAVRVTGAAYYYHLYPKIEQFISEQQGIFIPFDSLVNDFERTFKKIGNYLKLNVSSQNEKTFVRNTSHTGKRKKSQLKGLTNLIEKTFSKIPFLPKAVIIARGKVKPDYPVNYRLLKQEFFAEELTEEFTRTGQHKLIENVQDEKITAE